jgi:hypothetical protein
MAFRRLAQPARFALLLLASVAAAAQTPSPIDLSQAKTAFAEAEGVSNKDDGRL